MKQTVALLLIFGGSLALVGLGGAALLSDSPLQMSAVYFALGALFVGLLLYPRGKHKKVGSSVKDHVVQ